MLSFSLKAENTIYKEIILEDFEKNNYGKKQIITKADKNKIILKIRDENPAPNAFSTRYLSLESLGPLNRRVLIRPKKKIIISDYVRKITLWAYGQNDKSSLFIIIKNNLGFTFRLRAGFLNFKGWKKLTIPIASKLRQMNTDLYNNSYLELWGISFVPVKGNFGRSGIFLYLDDIKALVRKKYLLRPEKFND